MVNPAAFAVPVASYGNMRKTPFQVPSNNNLDFSLVKVTPIWESVSLEFRAKSFNLCKRCDSGEPRNDDWECLGLTRDHARKYS